ncbi:hypothetical protein DFJ63DRAFT_333386 [Scheffersomyces coipomensis]|uniref:uncharacterized protein n=1 Tax=Scheffersomyces coipomensis TaxID=1788519 RepID=UPI00315C9218
MNSFSANNRVAVVCSARSSQTKSEGTTSRLLRAADLANENKDFQNLLDVIEEDHVNNAKEFIVHKPEVLQKLIEDTKQELFHALQDP